MPVDREDRAAAAKSGARTKKVRKIVRKKPAPLPVPSLTIGHTPAPPKAVRPPAKGPKPRPTMMDVKKPEPHGGHKPVRFLYTPIEDLLLPPPKGSAREREIKRWNQTKERRRRDDARLERQERQDRRAEILKLPKETRRMLGRDAIEDYVLRGPQPDNPGFGDMALGVVKALPGLAKSGALGSVDYIDRVVSDWRSELSAGVSGRSAGQARVKEAEDNDLIMLASEGLIGHDLMKAARGEEFDGRMALVEAALLGIPIKGLPTSMSAALRATIGAQRFGSLLRRGATVGDALKHAEWTKPVLTARAQRRAALRASGQARSSSWLAGKLAGQGDGRVRNWIRNDPSEQRVFTLKGTDSQLDVETPADLSRIGRSVRRRIDRHRNRLGYIPGITSQEKMVDKVLAQQAEVTLNKYAGVKQALKLPRNSFGQVDWAGVYAVRAVLKNTDIGDVINRTAADLAAAEAKGDDLGARALLHHLNYFKAATRYIERDAAGNPVLRADAPIELEELRRSIENATDAREGILRDFDLLTESRARERVLNEQRFYQGAVNRPRSDWIQEVLEAHPVRAQALEVLTKHHPASRKKAMFILDNMARTYYEGLIKEKKEDLATLRHLMLEDPGDEVTMNARYLNVRRLQQDMENLSPAVFYEHFSGVTDELPPDVVAELTSEYGAQGADWFFRMRDLMGDGSEDARRIADEIHAEGLKLPPELDTPEKLEAGIRNVFQLAREGEQGKDWYPEAAQGVMLVSEHTGVPPKEVAQLFAIFSQAADTVANATFVFDAIRQFQIHGDLFSGRFPVRQSEEAMAVLQGGKWEGRKRSSFYANILRHIPGMEDEYAAVIKEMAEDRGAEILHPVTVDRWVVRMFTPESKKDVPGQYYDTLERIVQRMAASQGWEPEQIQAAAWVAMKDRGLQAETAKGGRKTVRHLAGAEDAFQYGIRRQIEREAEAAAQGGLFEAEKYAVTPAAKRLANKVNKKWGGFTVDRDLKPVPEEGYSVTLSLTETEFPLHKIKPADIEQFKARYAALLKDKRHKIGGFSDDANEHGDGTEVSYLSITRHFKRKADAMKFAREQGQETVYEYKTGDGIRTGLTRDEQREIIEGLREAEAVPRGLQAKPLPTDYEREYDKLLGRVALHLNLSRKKVPTPTQKSQAEDWMLRHGHEYPDEPIIKEWQAAYDARPSGSPEPEWMQFRLAARAQAQGQPINPAGIAEDMWGIQGQRLAEGIRGYKTAVKELERADIPRAFIKRVWNDPNMHVYDKVKIGLHLNRLSDGGLRGRAFPDIPGAEKMFDKQQLGGMYMGDRRLVVQSPSGRGIDMLHEFFHGAEGQGLLPPGLLEDMRAFVGAPRTGPSRELTTQQAEDMADMWEAMFLGFVASKSKLPKPLKKKMAKFAEDMKSGKQGPTKRAQAMLDKMPEEMRLNIEDALWLKGLSRKAADAPGMYGHGPNYIHREGGRYVPEQQGLPFSFSERLAGPRRYGTLYNRLKEGRRVQTLTPTDQALEHAFTGRLLASGRWARDVTAGPLHGLIKAMEIEKMAFLRDNILDATVDSPVGMAVGDAVAIPVDPKAFAEARGDQSLADLFALFDVMDSGLPVHAQQLDAVTVSGIEQAKQYFFPGYRDAREIEDLIKQAADKPIPGIRWISRQHLDRTGMLSPPGLNARIKNTWAKRGMSVYDDTNNILKLLTLSLNPSYYTMNLTGQGVMLLMQQGAFAPVSLTRSLLNLHGLSDDAKAILQAHAGVGQASIISSQGGLAKGVVDLTQRFANAVIDTHPRMAAITYEARRLGYKTSAELEDLITNPANFQDLFTASRRANRSMVDFQNLSYAEREYIGRLVFVYPWLRASAKWAAQFPFDHPIQTAALAGLLYWQQQRLKESFPEGHPGYLKWYFPIEGGEDPYGFRLDQAFTPLQPLDLAAEVAWLISGESVLPWGANEEALVGRLNPLIEEIITATGGYDAFRQEEVQRSLLGFFRRIVDPEQRYASWKRIKKVLDHSTHEGLYDTNQTQNWLRVILGSLAPVDVDTEVAAQMSAPTKTIRTPDVQPAEKEREFMQDVRERAAKEGVEVPDDLEEQYQAYQTYSEQESQFKRDHDIDPQKGLKPQERLAVLILTWGVVRGREADAESRVAKALAMSEEEAEAAIEEGREALGISRIERIKGRLGEAATAEREVVAP